MTLKGQLGGDRDALTTFCGAAVPTHAEKGGLGGNPGAPESRDSRLQAVPLPQHKHPHAQEAELSASHSLLESVLREVVGAGLWRKAHVLWEQTALQPGPRGATVQLHVC